MNNNNSILNHYSTVSPDEVIKELNSSPQGLFDEEVKKRLQEFGPNIIAEKEEMNIVWQFLAHFKNPLIIILFIATAISALFGEITNAIIIAVMIILSAILDFFEEYSAGEAAKKLKEAVKTTATVIRGGRQKEIKTAQICVGDIIVLSAGDLVPADGRIISADDFFVNQAALTGESFPCEKQIEAANICDICCAELSNIIFLGTNVISGSAKAIIVKTGQDTEFGHIAKSLTKPEGKSEFEIGVDKFGYFIMKVVFVLVLFIFLFNSLINERILESFLFALAIAVGVTPELLPMIISITMSRGSLRMSKKGVIVKKLSAVPDIGSMDVLCTDKTGTLTENNIILVTYTDIFGKNSDEVLLYTYLNSFYETGIKNPLDKAVLAFKKIAIDKSSAFLASSQKHNGDFWKALDKYEKKEEIPFDFSRKVMSVAVADPNGVHYLITKGAPEEIFKKCSTYSGSPFDDVSQKQALNYYHELSAQGYRVLAVGLKKIEQIKDRYVKADESNLELLGFVAFLDPAKKDVKEVLNELETMGIEVKVITGDNELVAQKICTDVGLKVKGTLLETEIQKMDDDALKIQAEKSTIFARFSPAGKNKIISILKSNNHVVGYLGDGINDAPALKNADVGVSVNNAVDVAKESADFVLTHKSLRVLKDGVLEGRKVFANTMKYVMMGLSSNFGNMFSVVGAIFYLPFLPMLPIQILLNNFIYDISQITIPTDNVDKDWIAKPHRWDMKFIKKFMYTFGPISSLFDFITFFVLFGIFHTTAAVFQTGWFMESLATQTLIIHIIRTKQLPFVKSKPGKYLLFSTFAAIIIAWIIPFTFIGKFFQFTPLSAPIIFSIIAIVVVYLGVVEVVKRVFYRKFNFRA